MATKQSILSDIGQGGKAGVLNTVWFC